MQKITGIDPGASPGPVRLCRTFRPKGRGIIPCCCFAIKKPTKPMHGKLALPYFVVGFVFLLLFTTAFLWYPPLFKTSAVPADVVAFFNESEDLVCINTATLEELCVLPGIGEKKAEAIIAYREDVAALTCVNDLVNISGIGDKTAALLEKLVRF